MKVRVTLSDDDVAFLDRAAREGSTSRAAVLREAIRMLRAAELADAYEHAWEEWATSPDDELWDFAAADLTSCHTFPSH